jgi:O-antigen/teichoic acid export membrane protein
MVRFHAPVIMLNRFSTSLEVTLFHLANMVYRQLLALWNLVAVSLFPVLTALHATSQLDRLRSAHLRAGRYALWMVLAVGVPCAVFGRELYSLYAGIQFSAAGTVLLALVISMPLELGNILLTPIARAKGAVRELAIRTLVQQTLNLGMILLLVGGYGMGALGAALAALATALVIEPLVMCPFALRLVNCRLEEFLLKALLPGVLPAVPYLGLLLALKSTQGPDSWLAIGLCGGFGLVVYLALVYLFGFREQDRKDIGQALTSLVERFSVLRRFQKV